MPDSETPLWKTTLAPLPIVTRIPPTPDSLIREPMTEHTRILVEIPQARARKLPLRPIQYALLPIAMFSIPAVGPTIGQSLLPLVLGLVTSCLIISPLTETPSSHIIGPARILTRCLLLLPAKQRSRCAPLHVPTLPLVPLTNRLVATGLIMPLRSLASVLLLIAIEIQETFLSRATACITVV